jgi:Ca2+-binding EF-hand superfamily protein
MFDIDQSTEIDLSEFSHMIRTINSKFELTLINEFFDTFDQSKDGRINFDEFKKILS